VLKEEEDGNGEPLPDKLDIDYKIDIARFLNKQTMLRKVQGTSNNR